MMSHIIFCVDKHITINNKHYLGASQVFKKKDLYLSRTALKWFWFEAQTDFFWRRGGGGGGGGYNLNLKSYEEMNYWSKNLL